MEICDLFNENVLGEDVDQYSKRCDEILTKQAILIENELGVAARVKFLDRIGTTQVIFSKAKDGKDYNKDYNNILITLNRFKDNLEELIKTEAWN